MKPASQCDPGSHPASVTNLRLRLTAFAGALTRDGVVRVSGLSVCGCFESIHLAPNLKSKSCELHHPEDNGLGFRA